MRANQGSFGFHLFSLSCCALDYSATAPPIFPNSFPNEKRLFDILSQGQKMMQKDMKWSLTPTPSSQQGINVLDIGAGQRPLILIFSLSPSTTWSWNDPRKSFLVKKKPLKYCPSFYLEDLSIWQFCLFHSNVHFLS